VVLEKIDRRLTKIIKLESAVREAFIKKEHMVAIYFDLEKAYDTTWKYGIMKDLYDAGLRGRMPRFISNVLTGRKFSVSVDTIERQLQLCLNGIEKWADENGFKFSKSKTLYALLSATQTPSRSNLDFIWN